MILEVAGIETFYGETQALFGVSLTVGQGEVVALLGPNGAGKTSTLRSILGLTPARRGAIRFDGHIAENFQQSKYAAVVGQIVEHIVIGNGYRL